MSKLTTKSILDQVDPRLKILITILLTVVTFMISNWLMLGFTLFVALVLTKLANFSLMYCFRKLRSPAIMMIVMLILQFLMMPHIDALWHGLLIFGRLVIVMMSWFVLISTTTQTEFILSLAYFLLPVKKIGFKTGAIMLTFRMIQRFVPTLMQEANKILKAQAARGLDIKGANIWIKMRLIIALLLPIFVVAIKRADGFANTMAVRGYVLNQKRTTYQTLKRMKS